MWLAKNKDGSIHLFDLEPHKAKCDIGAGKYIECWDNDDGESMEIIEDYDKVKDLVFWEDEEPLEFQLTKVYKSTPEEIAKEKEKERIKSLESQIFTIKGVNYKLVYYEDNSAPCCHCAFLGSKLECKFPKEVTRLCEHNSGTNKGWNTLEYK